MITKKITHVLWKSLIERKEPMIKTGIEFLNDTLTKFLQQGGKLTLERMTIAGESGYIRCKTSLGNDHYEYIDTLPLYAMMSCLMRLFDYIEEKQRINSNCKHIQPGGNDDDRN